MVDYGNNPLTRTAVKAAKWQQANVKKFAKKR